MKNQKGITLIAIVITVIVMLVLAGTAITLSIGDNGVINKTEKASNKSYIAESKSVILEGWAYVLSQVEDKEMPFTKYIEGVSPTSEKEKNKLAEQLLKSYLKGYGNGTLIPDANNNFVYEIRKKDTTSYIKAYKVEFLNKGRPESEKKVFYIGIDNKVYYDAPGTTDELDEIIEVR